MINSKRISKPNVLIYCTDQQRADLLGCADHSIIKTPNIDALAARGVRLSNFYVQGTACMPSRSSILTGQYPCSHRVMQNGYDLSDCEPTIGDVLQKAGYHTACVGRTHVTCSEPHPVLPDRDYHGFRECHHSQTYWEGLDPHGEYQQWLRDKHSELYDIATMPDPVNRKDARCSSWWKELPQEISFNSWVTDTSLDTIGRHRCERGDQPFFLWAGVWDPHSRFCVPEPWDEMYSPEKIPSPVRREGELEDLPSPYRRGAVTKAPEWATVDLEQWERNAISIYYGMISHIDDQFGRLVNGLEEMGELENTVILFLSDHGEMLGDHWVWGKGAYWFDGALKIPGVLYGPGLPAGHVAGGLTETVDILPTLCELAGVTEEELPSTIQGRSMLEHVQGEQPTHRDDVYSEKDGVASIRNERFRIVRYVHNDEGELYDFKTDPDNLYNRWNDPDYADVKQEMECLLLSRIIHNHRRAADRRTARY